MKLKILKDLKKRLELKKKEPLRTSLRFLIRNEKTPYITRLCAARVLNSMPRKSSITQTHNFCVRTGRSRGVLKPYFVSRIQMRDLIGTGLIPGISRSVW